MNSDFKNNIGSESMSQICNDDLIEGNNMDEDT